MHGDLKIRGYTVGQAPNPPMIVALIALILSLVLLDGSLSFAIARGVFLIAFTVWAWEELSDGVNGFRRGLGAAGLLVVLILLVSELT
jgi:hypothetical protein